ncbi:MAG TPA: hypothetical protein VGP72_18330 [Planctomycetota bacterium]|jgi:hypothetical protein
MSLFLDSLLTALSLGDYDRANAIIRDSGKTLKTPIPNCLQTEMTYGQTHCAGKTGEDGLLPVRAIWMQELNEQIMFGYRMGGRLPFHPEKLFGVWQRALNDEPFRTDLESKGFQFDLRGHAIGSTRGWIYIGPTFIEDLLAIESSLGGVEMIFPDPVNNELRPIFVEARLGLTQGSTRMIDFNVPPPEKLLSAHNSNVGSDTPFRSWCRLKQSLYRQNRGLTCGAGGKAEKQLGNYLTAEDAKKGENFLSPEIFKWAQERVANREPGDNIETKRLFGNMLTSQTLCFNLFLPQVKTLPLATLIWRALLPSRVHEVTNVKLEHSPGRGHPELGTGDRSAFDAFVEYTHCDGERGLLAIETKYTDSFSSKGKSPTDREYRLALSTGLCDESGWRALNEMSTQQLWRTHLLAETMRGHTYKHVAYVVLFADGDTECATLIPKYAKAIKDGENRFFELTLESFVEKVRPQLSGNDLKWLQSFFSRYLDWSPVEAALRREQSE